MEKIKFGVIGISEGNGHPYSWSAIFNGFNTEAMALCPFPVIPGYLNEREFPLDFLTDKGEVTHIYTQDYKLSVQIAEASNIKNIVEKPEDLIGQVDAILLARDDAENHYEMAKIFIEAGLPVYIDKPLALSKHDAKQIFKLQKQPHQIFTCSALRFAKELLISDSEREEIGEIVHVEASISNKWDTYSIHIIESIISQIPLRGKLLDVKSIKKHGFNHCLIEWENTSAYIKTTGEHKKSITFEYYGKTQTVTKTFVDSFSCFKNALDKFVNIINKQDKTFIDEVEVIEIIEIIERAKK
ncbi:Gfo/Idh/MocA family oxidoreductase [Bizionia sp.]|uniref:Gfo/Idh/MocA family oxidoreductase n=1 Tax=Bizionia sp. TaxID=1954480 RepID=UPI003A95CFF9